VVSEDLEKILALVIVALSFLSIPLLLFFFVFLIFIDVNYFVQFYYTRNTADAAIAIVLAILEILFLWFLRALIKWVRR